MIANRLATINRLIERQNEIKEEITHQCRPYMSDYNQLSEIYEICTNELSHVKNKVEKRRVFLFIAIYLYCPARLFGGKMPKGFRRALIKAIGMNNASNLSSDCHLLVDFYLRKDFFRYVEDAFASVANRYAASILNRVEMPSV